VALNAEQIFIDALGREPTADELQDIRLNLWMFTRAGFAVEDPSNAPLITPWAWMWARLPRPTETRAALAAVGHEIAERSQKGIETLEAIARDIPAKFDYGALATAIAEHMPPLIVRNRIDASVFTAALRESFTLIWVSLAAFCIGLAGVLGWHFGALHAQTPLAPRVVRHAGLPHHPQQAIERLVRPRPRP
jgi:hypothetical protein